MDFTLTAHLDVDKPRFTPSIALHVARGYHIYHTEQQGLKPFLSLTIFFPRIFISENFQQEPKSL